MAREDGWEGDLIIRILIIRRGKDRGVWILTDQDKYKVALEELRVTYASSEYSMPLFDPDQNLILIGQETESHVTNGKERRLVEKVSIIALAKKAA